MDSAISDMRDDIVQIKEDATITRVTANTIAEWADDASIQIVPLFGQKRKA